LPPMLDLPHVADDCRDGRLHVHLASRAPLSRAALSAAWPHGSIQQRRNGPERPSVLCQQIGEYLSRRGRAMAALAPSGQRIYGISWRTAVPRLSVSAETYDEALAFACELLGGSPHRVVAAHHRAGWQGPATYSLYRDAS
jgi:hypothetical protein